MGHPVAIYLLILHTLSRVRYVVIQFVKLIHRCSTKSDNIKIIG